MEERRVSMVLFDGFELLDVFGPLEVFATAGVPVTIVGPPQVAGGAGVRVVSDVGYADAAAPDVVVVPGGPGTRALASDAAWLGWLAGWAAPARLVASVCTGSALLAAAGLLNGRRATSNLRAFDWASGHGRDVEWVRGPRWVEDGDRWTSAGVSAGIDMALALVGALCGPDVARDAAVRMEYDWRGGPVDEPIWDELDDRVRTGG